MAVDNLVKSLGETFPSATVVKREDIQ
jgi:hypothetical protein